MFNNLEDCEDENLGALLTGDKSDFDTAINVMEEEVKEKFSEKIGEMILDKDTI